MRLSLFMPSTQHTLAGYRRLRNRLDKLTWSTDFATARLISKNRLALYQLLSKRIKQCKRRLMSERSIFEQRGVIALRISMPPTMSYGQVLLQPNQWAAFSEVHWRSVYKHNIVINVDDAPLPAPAASVSDTVLESDGSSKNHQHTKKEIRKETSQKMHMSTAEGTQEPKMPSSTAEGTQEPKMPKSTAVGTQEPQK